jgi:pyruvate formate lyase activating enzyme
MSLELTRSHNWQIKGFVKTSLIDWPGKICSVIFLPHCNLRCPICHNAKLVEYPEELTEYPFREIYSFLYSKRNWIDGVTITGGEPTLSADLPLLLSKFKAMGLKIKLDTNGTRPRVLKSLLNAQLVDAVFMDIKAPLTTEEYSRISGVSVYMKTIMDSISLLKASPVEVVFRTTVIPGLIQEQQLAAIRNQLGSIRRFIVQPFKNEHVLNPAFKNLKPFSMARISEMKAQFEVPMPLSEIKLVPPMRQVS